MNSFEITHGLINYLEIHNKFSRAPKILKLGSKFIIVLLHHGKYLSTPCS
jgi:hypothetical protein